MRQATTRRLALLGVAGVIATQAFGAGVSTAAAADPLDAGSGGPILVLGSAGDQYTRYYAEILRAEGLNEFDVRDFSQISPATLGQYGVVILGKTGLSDQQAGMLQTWVQSGGDLIAMRPDVKLDGLLGVTRAGGTYSDEQTNDTDRLYLAVNPSSGAGAGITTATMQFHGTADGYVPAGAETVAKIYSNATTATPHAAVTLNSAGSGQAAAFAFDVARSVIATRQGNVGWEGQERDNQNGPIRSNNLFFGGEGGLPPYAVLPDWVNLDKVTIPQADELQRLLANLVTEMHRDAMPLPRFWYLPRGEKAAVVVTGDDHGSDIGTATNFARLQSWSAPGCSVDDWQCVRATSYLYPEAASLTDAQLAAYQAQGFEAALHLDAGCGDFASAAAVSTPLTTQLAAFKALWPSAQAPATNRTHCVPWSDWSTMASVEASKGIRLDTNYYYWPNTWVAGRPGLFTGSGLPMRFADQQGGALGIYQATTQLTDELVSQYVGPKHDAQLDQVMRQHIAALLDNALGASQYVGAFTTNMHTDYVGANGLGHPGIKAIVEEAQSRGVPVISARQLLEWVEGRNGSSFRNLSYVAATLRFSIDRAAGSRGLQAMVPMRSAKGPLGSITRDGVAVPTQTRAFKGQQYAVFTAQDGAYAATYLEPSTRPVDPSPPVTIQNAGTATATAKPKLRVISRVVRVTRSGKAVVKVACPKTTACRVTLKLKRGSRVWVTRTLTIAGGRTTTLTLKLGLSARRQLRSRTSMSVKLSATAAGTTSASQTLTLLRPR